MGRIKDDRTNTLGVLGKVKVGMLNSNKSGKSYPTSIDYFRFTSGQESRVKRMTDMFGDKPTRIPITFHTDDTDVVCDQRYEIRDGAGKLICHGDGIIFHESHPSGFIEKDMGDKKSGEAYMAKLASNTGSKWEEVLILRFMVMKYTELGLWEFRTKGKETSIGQIISAFDTVMDQAGRVKGIPFWLTVEKHKSNRAGANRQYPVVNLVCDLSPEMVETVGLIGAGIKGLVTPEKLQSLPPSKTEEEVEFEEVEQVKVDVLTMSDKNFEKAVDYFFQKGASLAEVLQVRPVDKEVEDFFSGMEEWYVSYKNGDVKESDIKNNIDEKFWKYFEIKGG